MPEDPEAERIRRIERYDALCASFGPTAMREKLRRLKKRRDELKEEIAERRREAQGRGFIHGHCWLRREYGQLGAPATPPGPPPSQPAAPTAQVHRYNN